MPNIDEVGQAVPDDLIFGRNGAPMMALIEKEEVVRVTPGSTSTDQEALDEALKIPARSVHGYTVSLNI